MRVDEASNGSFFTAGIRTLPGGHIGLALDQLEELAQDPVDALRFHAPR